MFEVYANFWGVLVNVWGGAHPPAPPRKSAPDHMLGVTMCNDLMSAANNNAGVTFAVQKYILL